MMLFGAKTWEYTNIVVGSIRVITMIDTSMNSLHLENNNEQEALKNTKLHQGSIQF